VSGRLSLFDLSGPAGPGAVPLLDGGSTPKSSASGGLVGRPQGGALFPEKYPGETVRNKHWHMFRAPDGRAISILTLWVAFGNNIGRESRFECPAIGFVNQGAKDNDGQLEMFRRIEAFAVERLGCPAEELEGAMTCAWRGEERAVVDFWVNGAGHDGHKN